MDNQKKHDLFDYKLHLTMFFISIIPLSIGIISIDLFGDIKLIILPLIFSLFLAIICFLAKPLKWIAQEHSQTCSIIILLLVGPLIAKLAVAGGQNIEALLTLGPMMFLKELGHFGSIFIGLPIALLLGFKRESIGMSSSICREPEMAVIIDKYGSDSDEFKGFLIVYLIGTVLGTLMISLIVNFLVYLIPLHPFSYALASGVGSTSMSVAAISSLTTIYPEVGDKLLAYASMSNLISLVFNIYPFMFIWLPLTDWLYDKFEGFFN